MLNKLNQLCLLILCAGLLGAGATGVVSAQTGGGGGDDDDRVIVAAGKKPLKQSEVNVLIEFYEWAFEAKFTADERGKFQNHTAVEFRADPAESRKVIDDIINTFPQILVARADVQAETRKNFLALFLPEARKNTDENSRLLLAIYETARGGRRTEERAEENDAAAVAAPTKSGGNGGGTSLIGKWSRGVGGGHVDYTGKTRYKSGTTYTFEFFADGTVEYVSETDVLSIVQCRTKGTDSARGRFTVSGDTMTINLGAMRSVGSSSCEAKGNYDKTSPASSVTKKFVVKKMDSITRPDNPVILCFDGQDGDGCFERVPAK